MSTFATQHWPREIRLKQAEKRLEIEFDDGAVFSLPAELLRVESPSAEVMGHGPSQKQIVAGRREVGILALEPVGNYAVQPSFSDGHDSGIFSWDYLYFLGSQQEELWRRYEERLRDAGVDRDSPMPEAAASACGHHH